MYFGPGVHAPLDLPNNLIRVPGNTTVYLAPGAVLKAKLLVDGVEMYVLSVVVYWLIRFVVSK